MRRLALFAPLALAACVHVDVVAVEQGDAAIDAGRDAALDAGALDAADAAASDAPDAADVAMQPSFCAGHGPSLLVSDVGLVTCGASAGTSRFVHAACVCGDLAASAAVRTDAFTSASGLYATTQHAGGPLAADGLLSLSASTHVGAELAALGGIMGGAAAVVTSDGDASAGAIAGIGDFTFPNLLSAGSVMATRLVVPGTLTLPASATISVGTSSIGTTMRAPVGLSPECACSAGALAGRTAARSTDNDDALVGLSPDALASFTATTTLELPCGRLYLSAIDGSGDLTLVVRGRTALHVSGVLRAASLTVVAMGSAAELDLVVESGLAIAGATTLGDPTQPGVVRLFVESGTLELGGDAMIDGVLYAPTSRVNAHAGLEVYGALLAGQLAVSGALLAHLDESGLDSSDACAP